jgi:hypothetical protein
LDIFMKNTSLRKIVVTLSLLMPVGYAGIATAHDQSGSLGAPAKATDMYLVTCSDFGDGSGATEHLYLQISGFGPGLKVSAQVFKDGKALNSTAGVVVGKALNGGDGDYTVTVNKSAAGNATYGISYHCESKSGGHTDTTIRQLLPDQ